MKRRISVWKCNYELFVTEAELEEWKRKERKQTYKGLFFGSSSKEISIRDDARVRTDAQCGKYV